MNLLEIFIVYLACGAPFGVYFFFQNRRYSKTFSLILKSFLTVIVWIPYAFQLLNANITKKINTKKKSGLFFENADSTVSELEKKLEEKTKQMQQNLPKDKSFDVSVFEFREVVERFAGLTLALKNSNENEFESELLEIAKHKNATLGTKCLQRRNRSRLEFHQTQASNDFLKLLENFSTTASEKFRIAAFEFAKLLDDGETLERVQTLFAKPLQTEKDFTVIKQGEKAVWSSREERKQSTAAAAAAKQPVSISIAAPRR